MDVIFKSVVGKLWMTIIALFALVLTLFSLMLVQSFDSFYFNRQTKNLQELAEGLSESLAAYPDKRAALGIASSFGAIHRTGLVMVDQMGKLVGKSEGIGKPMVPVEQLLAAPELKLSEALAGKHPAPGRILFTNNPTDRNARMQIMAVAVPIELSPGMRGAIVMYQAIEDFDDTVREVRKLIFVVGVIGFILTTVFAFFLSSRITSPLRQMKETAHRIAEGDFHAEIPIRTTDEIGELAASFNTMASRLNQLVDALSKEKEQLASVLRSMVDGVVMIDEQGKIAVANPPAKHFLRDWEYEHPDEPVPLFAFYQQVVQSGREVTEDLPVQGRIWSLVMVPLNDREQIRGAVAVLRDMTRERKLDKMRSDFVANVSHELRTPLSMLQGYSEAIVDDMAASPEEHKELARIIYDESVRMTKLVNELLSIARMEAGHVELNLEQIELRPYLERIQRKFSNLAKEREIHLLLEIDTKQTTALVDPDKMEQVLTNLIDNALRHTPNEGTVTLRARGDKTLLLEVCDTGSGIPQEDLPFVFERFYKADKARTRGKAGGTGLGLAIAKNLVEAHGGTISVQSKLGEGTTFTIALPDKPKNK
ncbi:ATP-binding protein [Brevibacillus aydinogluensis]|uniref:histidine kinase n=1 Tax=Brevibacillus aydinogluensis TaxID=927786 RepID=A0AA48RHZ7_9BACL|nr:ATP-binding protein [Brevibacillus aydinogluensis]MDT3415324.1 two-component system sensor histidine kinase ResE [Brevibacillus aydinogluensis]NNV02662.1 HAMP domain-containing protein [Brevibacillus sp. MCWH]REK62274.1 MAG: PAS domain-containing sensor histidine kinase [Brevibacillus sp.]CAJ1002897.1 histidine kinase [Brevibacillus aydinogluensis]